MSYNITLFFDQVQDSKNKVPLEKISKNNMDGIFILSVENDTELAYKIGKINLPIVLVNQRIKGLDIACVAVDDEGGAYKAVSHLLDMGHKSIAFIGGHPKYSTSEDRRADYERAAESAGENNRSVCC